MKVKGLIFVALLLSVIALTAIGPVKAETTLYLDPASVTTDPPQVFSINLTVGSVTDLRAWDIKIRWNPSVIKFINITEGPLLKSGGDTEMLYNLFLEYVLSAGCTIKQANVGVSGSGVLATICFQTIDTGDPFTILFESSTLLDKNNAEITHTTTGTTVTTQSPVISFSRKVLTDVSGQRANDQNPAPNDTVRFDARASYAQPKLVGDIDRSGRVDSGDLGALGVAWFKTPGQTGWNPDADIDCSNRVDSGDLGLLGVNWFRSGGKITNFRWEVDGTVIAQGKDKSVIEYTFTDYSDYDGYTVNLTVTDGNGRSWSKSTQVRIWRDIAAIDVWPCYDDYLGTDSVMNGDKLDPGTILFITGAYRNLGTLKQTYKAEIYLRNNETGEILTLFTRTRTNIAPESKASLWYPPTLTGMGMEVNDPQLGQTLVNNTKLMFVDYDGDGSYTWGGCERPIWDTDGSGTVTVGDIAVVENLTITEDDPDINLTLTFDPLLKWVDSNGNDVPDIGETVERVYYDMDESGTVSNGDFYVWLEEYYYHVIYDVEIHVIPAGSYVMGIKVTAITAPVDLDPTNDVFEYSAVFTVTAP